MIMIQPSRACRDEYGRSQADLQTEWMNMTPQEKAQERIANAEALGQPFPFPGEPQREVDTNAMTPQGGALRCQLTGYCE
jgi:hypothetical protein